MNRFQVLDPYYFRLQAVPFCSKIVELKLWKAFVQLQSRNLFHRIFSLGTDFLPRKHFNKIRLYIPSLIISLYKIITYRRGITVYYIWGSYFHKLYWVNSSVIWRLLKEIFWNTVLRKWNSVLSVVCLVRLILWIKLSILFFLQDSRFGEILDKLRLQKRGTGKNTRFWAVRFSLNFHRNRSACIWFVFSFRRCWHGSCGQHFWHLELWPSRLLRGAAGPKCDWRRQSSHQHREETGKKQGHWWPYPQIRKSWRLLGFASAFLYRFLAAMLWTALETEACLINEAAVTRCARDYILVTAVQFIRGRLCLSGGGLTAFWQAAWSDEAENMLMFWQMAQIKTFKNCTKLILCGYCYLTLHGSRSHPF